MPIVSLDQGSSCFDSFTSCYVGALDYNLAILDIMKVIHTIYILKIQLILAREAVLLVQYYDSGLVVVSKLQFITSYVYQLSICPLHTPASD